MNTNANELAYPFVERAADRLDSINLGLTKREAAAIAAMQGLLAHHGRYWQTVTGGCGENLAGLLPDEAAARALEYADALLLELSKPQTP